MGIPIAGGGEITEYDADTMTVVPPNGQPVRVARAAAPASLRSAVELDEAQAAAAPPAPAGPQANPFGFVEGAPQAVGAAAPPTPGAVAPGGKRINERALQQSFEQLRASQQPPATATATVPEPGFTPEQDLEQQVQQVAAALPAGGGTGGGVRTSTQRTSVDPEAADEVRELGISADVAREDAAMAVEEGAAAEAKLQQQRAEHAAFQATNLDEQVRRQQADAADYQRRQEHETTKLKSLQAEADTKIDPKRWWREKSTGENILAALAMGLGAAGSALTGTPNFALQIIDKAIERDIDSQLANREGKYKQVAAQQDVLGILRGQYADKRDERDAAKSLMLERSAKYIEEITARSASDQTKAKGAEMAAQLREKSALMQQELTLKLAGQVTTQETRVPGTGGGNTDAQRAALAREAVYGQYNPKAFLPGAERIFGVPMQAVDETDGKELNKQVAASNDLLRTLDQMEANASKLSPQAKTNVKSLRAQAMLKIKNLEAGGALDAGMQDVANSLLGPDETDLTTITSALPQLKANIRASMRTNLGARAVRSDPQRVPLAHRSRYTPGGAGQTAAAPPTRPISE